MSYEDLKDKVVIVTGSSAGIGEAIALQFSKNCSKLVIHGRNEENLKKVALLCEQASPLKYKPMVHISDLSKESETTHLVKKAVEYYGTIDVLVNNAGCVLSADIRDEDFMKKFDYIMNVNSRAPLLLSKLCLPYLTESKGCIVNISSVTASRHDCDGCLNYSMSKGAIDSMTKYLAVELGPKGVRVNAINPGIIRSTIHTKMNLSDSAFDEFAKDYPLRRAGKADEVASLVCYLASNSASYITGNLVVIDGGYNVM